VQLLNSPESAMRGLLPPLHDDVITLDQCCSAASALIGVLCDVLDLSKMDAEGVRLRLATDVISDVVSDVVGQMRAMAVGKSGLAIIIDCSLTSA
jgi:K+-sensing histidine kinase KdpD